MLRRARLAAITAAAVVGSGLFASPLAASPVALAARHALDDVPSVPGRTVAGARGPAADEVTDTAWAKPGPPVREETAVVAVPARGSARAGSTPVTLSRAASGTPAAKVSLHMLSGARADSLGMHRLAFELTRADGAARPGLVKVSVDYSGIATMYGGDFATRLRLVKAGPCGDDTCAPTALAAVNDLAHHTLTVDVPVTHQRATGTRTLAATTYGVSSGPSGSAGNYTATSASPSDNWAVGIGSGAFTYSYDIDVPPAIGGAAPQVSVDYNSQSVDGRTVAQNAQPGIVGEGWSMEPGYIERKFATCSNGMDLCWSANNEYFLSFGGHSGEIVRVPGTTNEWRMRGQDPGFRILNYTGGSNDDNDNEFWIVITPNGVKYWLGLGYEPRNATTKFTHSAWTVPVYGGSGEPCYNATASASWCLQAYRWNVDFVKDTNDNVTSYFYQEETNYYARGGVSSQATKYTRGGYLYWIEYGQRYGSEADPNPAQITFYTSNRCTAQTACPTPSPSTAASYPDVPLDQMCSSSTSCSATLSSPTFWTTRQLDQIVTRTFNSAGTLENDSIYDLTYKFPGTSDGTSPSLWLDFIQKTGAVGSGTLALPAVSIDGVLLPNRVNTGTGVPAMNKWRVATIKDEYGGRVRITYDNPRPCPLAPAYPNFADNPYHCYPAWYQPPTGSGGWVSFHKYVVTQKIVDDAQGLANPQSTTYTYSDAPAWHYTDSILAPAGTQSWADYRGHALVTETQYTSGLATGEVTKHVIFRGMNGDKLTSTTSKVVTLTDTHGNSYTDAHYLQGLHLDLKRFQGDGTQITSTMHRYGAVQTANGPDGWQSHDAQYVFEIRTVDRVFDLDSTTGGYRDHSVDRTFDTGTNMILTSSDNGGSGTADDTCTKWSYTEDTTTSTSTSTEWLVDAPYRMIAYDGACGSGSTTVIAKSEYYYDGHAALTDPPTKRNITKQVDWYSSTGTVTTEKTFDAYGRITSVINPNEVASGLRRKTTTTYSPSTGYPFSGITTTDILGHTKKTELNMALGKPSKFTDENGDVTIIGVDALGRTTSVTRPGDSTYPSVTYEYTVSQTAANRVKSSTRTVGSSYVASYDYYDGLVRQIEHQDGPANDNTSGRRVTVTSYDTHGRLSGISQPMYNTGTAGSGILNPADTAMPFETRYGYDAMGRRNKVAQYALGVWKYTQYTDHMGYYTRVRSAVSDRGDVESYLDVFGRVYKVVEHPTAGGTANTSYSYTARGDIESITDDGGRVISYTYDWLRRRTRSVDPDLGTWDTGYDADGNATSLKDARQQTLVTVYDALGRRTELHSGTATGTLLASWAYDDAAVPNSVGRLTSSTRYAGTDAYVSRVTAYDARGRVNNREIVVPASEGTLQGTYAWTYAFDASDQMTSVTYPAIGSLAAETVSTNYNGSGLPTTLTGSEAYLASTTYSSDGRLAEQQLGSGTTKVVRTYGYDTVAGRPNHTVATYGATVLEDSTVTYDAESTVRSVLDVVAGSGGVGQRECFRYEDGLQRLTQAYTTGATCASSTAAANPDHSFGAEPYDVKYAYDDSGDIMSMTDGMTATTKAYTYGTTGPKHGVVTVGSTHAYAYDANGNVTTRTVNGATTTLGWDETNQLASSTPGAAGSTATTYRYDADGTRLIRRTGTDATLYMDGGELTTAGVATRYYGDVAMRKSTATGSDVTVLLRNRQGSAAIAVNPATGAVVSRRRYLPFGGDRAPATGMPTERGFLDKTQDPNGLYQVGARYYEPDIGRFVSPDPLVSLGTPQALASYTYSAGNPATYSDPSGRVMQRGDVGSSDTPPPPPPTTPTPAPAPTPGASQGSASKSPTPVPSATPGPAPQTPPTQPDQDPYDSAKSNIPRQGATRPVYPEDVADENERNGSTKKARTIARTLGLSCQRYGFQTVCDAHNMIPPGRAGYTIGTYFFTNECPDEQTLKHEWKHSEQWARYGMKFARMYLGEEAQIQIYNATHGGEDHYNKYERQAGLDDGQYSPGSNRDPPDCALFPPTVMVGGVTPASPVPGPSPFPPG